jgi:hypothetical protein
LRDDNFAIWLRTHQTKRGVLLGVPAQRDAKSRCRRIDRYEGDLDKHFIGDRMASLLNRLEYSSDISVRHSIPIKGDMANGTASLLNAANLYHFFCLDCPPTQR